MGSGTPGGPAGLDAWDVKDGYDCDGIIQVEGRIEGRDNEVRIVKQPQKAPGKGSLRTATGNPCCPLAGIIPQHQAVNRPCSPIASGWILMLNVRVCPILATVPPN